MDSSLEAGNPVADGSRVLETEVCYKAVGQEDARDTGDCVLAEGVSVRCNIAVASCV